jgi:hypothetical protein
MNIDLLKYGYLDGGELIINDIESAEEDIESEINKALAQQKQEIVEKIPRMCLSLTDVENLIKEIKDNK